jgi:ligand-binding SRPBCC domain-containing protein
MVTLTHETRIAAPAMRVFLLSLSIDLHQASAEGTGERAIAGVTHGIIGLGETVTWQGRHFGLLLKHEVRIVRCEAPIAFEDVMVRGMFKSFAHVHSFSEAAGLTTMRDVLQFSAPLGLLGRIAEQVLLRNHLDRFLVTRNAHIKQVAESEEWTRYLPAS